jgi:hypothetical protein
MRRIRVSYAVAAAALAVAFLAAPAYAACAPITEADALARANVVFEGVAQPGVTRDDGTLGTPARFSVLQYLKGTGPQVVSVTDAANSDPMKILSGEYWVIYGKLSASGVVSTSPCFGSYLGNGPKPFVKATSASPSATPTASQSPVVVVGPPLVESDEIAWSVSAGAGIVGLALVMAIGYFTAKTQFGTE